jgi:hypothetical protein
LGACWDPNADQYQATYEIPQCYEEQKIEFSATNSLQLYDPKLFKPVVPKQFMAAEGECDTNYFHISTLYYKRRACTYNIDMIKYGREFDPLSEPSRDDCLFRLGCCYEDNQEVMQQYPFLPRCFHRVKNEIIDSRLHDMRLVYTSKDWYKPASYDATEYGKLRACGTTNINKFLIQVVADTTIANVQAITAYYTANTGTIVGEEHLADKHAAVTNNLFNSNKGGTNDHLCLYMRNDWFSSINTAADFWKAFDIFDKKYIIETQVPQENIPVSLRGLMQDLF